jgi:hypothetical protein
MCLGQDSPRLPGTHDIHHFKQPRTTLRTNCAIQESRGIFIVLSELGPVLFRDLWAVPMGLKVMSLTFCSRPPAG